MVTTDHIELRRLEIGSQQTSNEIDETPFKIKEITFSML